MPDISHTTTWTPASDTVPELVPADLKKSVETDNIDTVLTLVQYMSERSETPDYQPIADYISACFGEFSADDLNVIIETMAPDDRDAVLELTNMAIPASESGDYLGYSPVAYLAAGRLVILGSRIKLYFGRAWTSLGKRMNYSGSIIERARQQVTAARTVGREARQITTSPGKARELVQWAKTHPGWAFFILTSMILGIEYAVSKFTGHTPLLTNIWEGAKGAGLVVASGAKTVFSWLPLIILGAVFIAITKE